MNQIKSVLSILTILFMMLLSTNNLFGQCCELEITKMIIAGSDDVEESATGNMSLESSDIELVNDGGNGNQKVGLRFTDLPLTPGVIIEEAYLHFNSDEEMSNSFSVLTITSEATDDAAPFQEINFNVSNRTRSNASVTWIVDSWTTPWEKSEKHKSPDLKTLVQETVNRPGWQAGNDLAFIITGSGNRSAIAYELDPARTAELVIKLSYDPMPSGVLQDIKLNELMASNNTIEDNFGDTDDWLEIYNGSNQPLFLGGLYLTDDMDSLQKWQVTSSPLIAPNEFGLIWADQESEQGGLHANFKLKSSGEFLALVQEFNGTLHILDSLTFPEVPQNISYGRLVDGGDEWGLFAASSPGASNNNQPQLLNESVEFSHSGGHYSEPIMLALSVNDPTANIYYTLDGTTPTDQSILYNGSVSVANTKVVKARAIKSGFVSLNAQSEFFIINEPSQLPILNVQSDPDNFWGDENGIYVRGTNGLILWCNSQSNNWNRDWERPCELTYITADGSPGFKVDAGMKIGGACSRNLKQKSLNFFMRSKEYGTEKIDYPIFSDQNINEYRRFKIRNGGTDWIEMLFRDAMNAVILDKTVDLDLMDYQPVRVYFNGEFWGIHGAREMFNKYYIESHHGADPDNIDLLGDPYGNGSIAREGDFERYNEMRNFVSNNTLINDDNYAMMETFLDLHQYINYHIAQVYLANYDWPANNVRIWRDRNNGKFRWLLFDTDASTGFQDWTGEGENDIATPQHNTIAHAMNTANIGNWPNSPGSTYLFRQMMNNADFKSEYIQRLCTFRELIFTPDRVLPMVDSLENLLLPEMDRHINHWLGNDDLGDGTPSGGSVAQWQTHVQEYRDFFDQRSTAILPIFQNHFNLNGRYNLTFGYDETTTGDIVIHGNEMEVPFNYQGEYFQNLPIKIKAIPHEGYFFSHWLETGNTNAEIDFLATEDQILTPIFTDELVANRDLNLDQIINIYPNPVADQLTIDLGNLNEKASLVLYDVFGKELLRRDNFQNNTTVSVKDFPVSIYLLRIETPVGTLIRKIIKN